MTPAPLAPDDVGALWDRIISFAEELAPEQWTRPTPCPAWDVRELLAHCSGIQRLFDGGPQPEPPPGWAPAEDLPPTDAWTAAGVAARGHWGPEEVLAELRAARDGHVARLEAVSDWDAEAQGPTGPTTEAGLVSVRCFDLWVHLWDLHTAVGEPMDLHDRSPAARVCHRFVLSRVPIVQAKVVGAPEGSALGLRLGAPLDTTTTLVVRDGRAGFDDAADPTDGRVDAGAGAFTLLLSGREDPDHWHGLGELEWTGDLGSTFVARARLF